VPAANLLGTENGGVAVLMSGLDLERAMIAPLCLGIAERALELAREYAQSREQFGRKIAEFQMIQAKLAEMYVAVETMRTFTYRVLTHKIVDNGDWSIMKKVGFDELVLSACHPLYSASQRYVVFARLANVKLAGASRGVNLPEPSVAADAA